MEDQNRQRAGERIAVPGSDVVLRSWEPEDAQALAQYADNPHIASALRDTFPSPYTLDDANRFIGMATSLSTGLSPDSSSGQQSGSSFVSSPGSPAGSSYQSSFGLLLAIDVDGVAVGGIAVTLLDDVYRRTAEIGYWLGEPFWGRGIVTDAVAAVVPVVFERFAIVRLQAGVFANNPASMRVLQKCGFVREAVLRDAITKNGVVMDEVMHARFRDR